MGGMEGDTRCIFCLSREQRPYDWLMHDSISLRSGGEGLGASSASKRVEKIRIMQADLTPDPSYLNVAWQRCQRASPPITCKQNLRVVGRGEGEGVTHA